MTAQVRGEHFHAVIGPLLDSAGRFGAYRERVARMRDDAWYPWDEFLRVALTLRNVLGDEALGEVAQRSALEVLGRERARGLDSVEKLFESPDALLRDGVRGLPRAESVRALALAEGEVVLESPGRLPASLLVGWFRGLLGGLGKCVTEAEVLGTGLLQRIVLRWR